MSVCYLHRAIGCALCTVSARHREADDFVRGPASTEDERIALALAHQAEAAEMREKPTVTTVYPAGPVDPDRPNKSWATVLVTTGPLAGELLAVPANTIEAAEATARRLLERAGSPDAELGDVLIGLTREQAEKAAGISRAEVDKRRSIDQGRRKADAETDGEATPQVIAMLQDRLRSIEPSNPKHAALRSELAKVLMRSKVDGTADRYGTPQFAGGGYVQAVTR